MNDISKEDAIYYLKNDIHNAKVGGHIYRHYEMAIEALKNQRIGHWINRHNIYTNKTFDTKVCSECRYEYSYDAETGISNANFCSNCGAKMEKR